MKIFYDSDVFMRAHMDILNKNTTETGFELQHISGELKSFRPKEQETRKEVIEIYNRKLDFVPVSLIFDMRLGF